MVSNMASPKAFNGQAIQKRVRDACAFLDKYKNSSDPEQQATWKALEENLSVTELGILADFKESTKLLISGDQHKFLTNVTDKIDELKKALGVR